MMENLEEKINLVVRNKVNIPVGVILAKTGITPNALTFVGVLTSLFAAIATVKYGLFIGAFCMFASSLFDTLDGAVAKATNRVTKFGAVLDDAADRISELFYFSAIFWLENTFSIFLAATTSFLVSYLAASAKARGYKISSGVVWGRPGRIVLLFILMILNRWLEISFTIWAITVLNIFALSKRGLEISKQNH